MSDLISIGSEVKMSDDGHVSGYLVLFGDPDSRDFDGDFFTAETDFDIDFDNPHEAKSTVYFHHGLDPLIGKKKLGKNGVKGSLKKDEVGIWIDAWLDTSDEYDQAVIKLNKSRKARTGRSNGWSSGVPPHLVEREEIAPGVYRMKKWALGKDASITPIPNDWRNEAVYVKSVSELSIADEPDISVKTDSVKTQVDGDTSDSSINPISQNEEKKMSEETTQTKSQDTPQEPVTLDAIKGLFGEFEQKLDAKYSPVTPEGNDDDKQIVNAPGVITAKNVNIQTNKIGGGDDSEGKHAFFHWMKTGKANSSLKALEGGTDSEGGYTVPTLTHAGIVERRDLASIVRNAPGFSMFKTISDNYNIPLEGDDSAAMDSTAEEAAATQNDPVFGVAAGVIEKYTREIRVTDELLGDSVANIESFLNNRVGREMAKAENAALHTALFAGGTAALTLDSNSAIGAGEIPEITGLMPSSWESGAIWNMRKSTYSLIAALTGNPFLFTSTPAGNSMGQGGMRTRELDGYDLYFNDQMDAKGADNQVISFYNPEAVGVIDRQGLDMIRDPYTLASTGMVKFVYKFRFDVIVLQAQAVLEIIDPGA